MKKMRLLSLFLALVLSVQCFALPVSAEPTEEGADSVSVSETGETDADSVSASETDDTIPEHLTGDTSITMGTHSINAQGALLSNMDVAVDAGAAIAFEIDTETMLYAYNVDRKMYPASMTKAMTCMVALDMIEEGLCALDEVITVPEEVIARVDPYGSSANLVAGEELTMLELLYCLMVASANDAAMVIADHLCGSEEAFVERMNQRAAEIGCSGTHFVNVHGLHDEDHYTTARDMARIMMEAIKNETFSMLYSTTFYQVEATNKSDLRQMYTTNYMLSNFMVEGFYDSRVVGGKTGFTTPAGRCLAAVSESNGMRIVTVIMGSTLEYAENGYTIIYQGAFESTEKIIDYVFDRYTPAQVLSENQVMGPFEVTDGVNSATGYVSGSVSTLVPVDSDVSTLRYEYALDDGVLSAPVAQDEAIGVVRVWLNARCVAQQEMYAAVSVERLEVQSSGKVDPASPVQSGMDLWQIVLMVILVLLALILLMVLISYIRAAVIRSRRRKRRQNRRRSR